MRAAGSAHSRALLGAGQQAGGTGVLALHLSSCLMLPTKEGRDWDMAKEVTREKGARMAAQMELLDPTETQHSCDISNMSPLTTDLKQTLGGCREGGEHSGDTSRVSANASSASLQTHSKNPSTRNLPGTAASSGDALPHDQNLLF